MHKLCKSRDESAAVQAVRRTVRSGKLRHYRGHNDKRPNRGVCQSKQPARRIASGSAICAGAEPLPARARPLRGRVRLIGRGRKENA